MLEFVVLFGIGCVIGYVAFPSSERLVKDEKEKGVSFPKPKSIKEFVECLKPYGDIIIASNEGLPIEATTDMSQILSAITPMLFGSLDEFGIRCDKVVAFSDKIIHAIKVGKYYVLILSEKPLDHELLKSIKHFANVSLPELLGE